MLRLAAVLATGLVAATAATAKPASDAEAAWRADIEAANVAYAVRPTAILKIDDAIYLKAGQTAWLVEKDGAFAWTLSPPAASVPSVEVSQDLAAATFSDGGTAVDLLAEGGSPHALSDTIRVGGTLAQISPEETGFRLMVFNDANPAAAAFTGLEYFPYDPSFVVEARLEVAPEWNVKIFQTSRGWYKSFHHVGDAVFTLKGKTVKLPMYAGSGVRAEVDGLSAFIMDDTTGKETYGVGRYIDVGFAPGAIPDMLTLDFNALYNPNCARSPHYNCPVAVDRVPVAITAGERKPSAHASN